MPLTVPLRFSTRSEREGSGLRPFSKEWLAAPPELRAPQQRKAPELPHWIPSERVIAAILVMLVVLATVITSGGGVPKTTALVAGSTTVAQSSDNAPAASSESSNGAVETPGGDDDGVTAEVAQTTAGAGDSPVETPAVGGQQQNEALLPKYRIISYYGHPHEVTMGILGEYSPEDLYDQLMDEVAVYEAADPSRPVMPAFELVTSVAQNWPADDDTYLLHTDLETIQQYVDFTREKGILLILDLQIGHSTILNEIDRVREWLAEPHVHLALDPEFAMPEGTIPGEVIGGLDAKDIEVAQNELAEIVQEYDLPPKVLIVHKFEEDMITNVAKIKKVDGVQTVIDFDGQGDSASKIAGYSLFLEEEPAEFAGIKLFYQIDQPLLQPEEVLAFDRPPDVVIYQ